MIMRSSSDSNEGQHYEVDSEGTVKGKESKLTSIAVLEKGEKPTSRCKSVSRLESEKASNGRTPYEQVASTFNDRQGLSNAFIFRTQNQEAKLSFT